MDDNDNAPQPTLTREEIDAAEKRVEQFLLMRPSTADYSAAEQFLYPDFPAGRLEYTDEESAAITRLAYILMRRRHIGHA